MKKPNTENTTSNEHPSTAGTEVPLDHPVIRPPYELNDHLEDLIAIDECEDSVFSFFLDIREWSEVENQLRNLGKRLEFGLNAGEKQELYRIEAEILDLLGRDLDESYQGLVVHVRAGAEPFFRVIAFHLPLRPQVIADRSPYIVPLIELRDTYDRYVVLISDEQKARIVEIVLGTVTREAWLARPDLRKRVGREWTREHYQNHRRDRDRRFVKEKIDLLSELMEKGGHSHLVLAGQKNRIAAIESELPDRLRSRIIDIRRLGVNDPQEKVVQETIQAFVEEESRESIINLERLRTMLLRDSGAVVGLDACEATIQAGAVDTLIVASSGEEHTQRLKAYRHRSPSGTYSTVAKRLEELLEDALAQDIPIEFVPRGTFLDDYMGCGAILRYRGAEHFAD